ncbi:MAG: hypothetical protein K1X92_10080 [Bacteroidia bacterium]|nr:hypothetical protein [Bacteroidia bacterium]
MHLLLQAQTSDILLQSDKIYSVLTIILLIFAGLIGSLLFTERKLSKIEKSIQNKKDKK